MKHNLTLLAAAALLLAGAATRADTLPNNFWVNPNFELGTNLDQTSGTVSNWNRGGGDPTICQVITNNSVSATHALAVVDSNTGSSGYGEWYSDVALSGHASPGDTLDIQWYEMYSLNSTEMRVTVLFFDGSGATVGGPTHFVTTGTTSPGWVSTIEDSTFTKRNGSLAVPPGAVKMRCSLVSGGSPSVTGVMLIDDLSVARSAVPNLLAGNFWINPSFELGSNLDQTSGTVSNWNRGGGDASIDQIISQNFTSSTHALAVVDTNTSGSGYGEWYSDVALAGNASPGDTLNLQWYEMYNISAPEMRLTVLFFDGSNNQVGTPTHFVTTGTNSPGWVSTIEDSTFTKRNASLAVPTGAVKMRCSLVSGGSTAVTGVMVIDDLSVARAAHADLLPGNFWVNSTFELGTGLDKVDGTPENWNRGGGDSTIDQVTTNNYTSASHALSVVDTNTSNSGYGEWYSDVALNGNASPGDTLNIQWFEMYSVSGPEMRLSVLFLDGTGTQVGAATHFVTTGTNSPGWVSTLKDSAFTKRNGTVVVPAGSVKMRCSLVSGGSPTVTGVMAIDDLSVNVVPPTVLTGNFFPNPTFELGLLLDDAVFGLPAGGWQRGGSASGIDQVTASNSVSSGHSLALVDNDAANYGEWYLFLTISNLVSAGDPLDFQWFQLYNVSGGSMRLSFAFLDAGNTTLAGKDYNVTGQSPGWNGSIGNSTFQRQYQRLAVPAGTTQLRVNFASGGASSVTGTMVIDDLSIRVTMPLISDVTADANGVNLTWYSSPSKTYKVLFTSALGATPNWTPLQTGVVPDSADGLTASYVDSAAHPGNQGF
ncbi:MAG TPA: hypothetical protein VFE51_30620, partial [Verrucomicrobiae bacterium]|nr:hypothetical protein [Verrucomicrobiae bacterium]